MELRSEASNRRVRVVFGGDQIVDTIDAHYVWEHPAYPQYAVPFGDVAEGVLTPNGTVTPTAFVGEVPAFDVCAGGKVAAQAAWQIGERVRFAFDAMDAWFEEDEEIFVHPRGPAHRIEILPTSRRVQVAIEGVTVADSTRAMFLFETTLPRRTYFPKLDVRLDLFEPTEHSSRCPYKGTARYWSMKGGPANIAWSYPAPVAESLRIAGRICFYDERVDVTVDGVALPRPQSPFS